MALSNLTPPNIKEKRFSCPHCHAFADQVWLNLTLHEISRNYNESTGLPSLPVPDQLQPADFNDEKQFQSSVQFAEKISREKPFLNHEFKQHTSTQRLCNCFAARCISCGEFSIWVHKQMVYPKISKGILPNPDMPEYIQKLFDEARQIAGDSPRGAAALLRLCIQHICIHLDAGEKINDAIAKLVKDGLNPTIQKALDTVRVIGNEAVHPGTIEFEDDSEVVNSLFQLVNMICDELISAPKRVAEMYESLPEPKREGIAKRDKSSN